MPARLKSLELHGYKTFAALTQFEFAGTITAIVGPNGSGKSNVADSIRWVLGEQSYSLLRGKKTEDMIFSGSELRPRSGMASATIVFDNSDGWLPIDFTEVAITRRAYRDGDNEYLLNRQRVRLKDVSELLAQSGLAERTYTIIGQGLVDAALALKAEERRRLFEEAAGIGLHRSRREEALRRLEITLHNLERVEDIMAELQPRLRSLERQARRAQEYDQVKADLRLLLREWYGYHWHRAQKELIEAREIARRQDAALEAHRQVANELDQKLEAVRKDIQNLRTHLSEWHRQSAQLHNQRESISRDLAVSDERMRSLDLLCQNSTQELDRYEEEIDSNQELLASATSEAAQIKSEYEEARLQVVTAQRVLQTRQVERQEVETKVVAGRQALTGFTAQQSHLQARLSERQAQTQRQEEALHSSAKALEQAQREVQEAEMQLQNRLQALTDRQEAFHAVEEGLQAHSTRVSELEAIRKEILDKRSTLRGEAARLRTQLDVLDQAEKTLTGYAEGAQLLIKAARQSQLTGARGILSNFLDIPAEMETAIAAALGEYADAILVEGDRGTEEALKLLEGQSSRAILIPLDRIKSGPDQTDPSVDLTSPGDVLGAASELVQAPDDLRPIVQMLLSQVWVVRDRQAARGVLQRIHEKGLSHLRLVTLRGEVFYAKGPILAGQEGKPGVLSRPRQRRELQKASSETEQAVQAIEDKIRQIEGDLSGLKKEGENLAQAVSQKRKETEAAQSAYNQQDLNTEKARRQLQWQRDQGAHLDADIERVKDETSQITSELRKLEKDIAQAGETLRQRNIELAALSLDEQQTQLAFWNTRAAVAQRAEAEALNRIQERQATLDKSLQNRLTLKNRVEEARSAMVKLEGEKANLREQEITISRQVEEIQALIDPAETELENSERKQAELQALETEARQTLSFAEHRNAQAKITLSKRQEALDSLRQRVEDDFGLVSFEYNEEVSGQTTLPLDGMVEQLPSVKELSQEIEESIKRQRAQLRRIGPINQEAQAEYLQVKERYEFLTNQVGDLKKAEVDVRQVIAELDLLMQKEFRKTFDAVAQEFHQIFTRLFGGGSARLILTDPEDLTATGIDIEARLPGRRSQGLSLLSGGERSLTATSLVFALLKVSPTPFCLLDEVDAMLDEANVGRFRELLRELSQNTQFIVVTHNRNTVQVADVIYGVTMGRDSSSQVISLRLDEVSNVVD
ncbi:MAG: chromosome segregation protein SMC [Omnitrophica WOR_2 bacterium]